jgi:hypothetical protein
VFQESSKAKLASFISVAHISQLLLGIIKILDNERVLHSFAIITYLASFFSIASSSNITKTSHLSKSTRNYQARNRHIAGSSEPQYSSHFSPYARRIPIAHNKYPKPEVPEVMPPCTSNTIWSYKFRVAESNIR